MNAEARTLGPSQNNCGLELGDGLQSGKATQAPRCLHRHLAVLSGVHEEGTKGRTGCSDANDLQVSLCKLDSLVIGREGLSDLLAHVAAFGVRAISGVDGAGVTVLRMDRPGHTDQVLIAMHPFVAVVDEVQYAALNEGPALVQSR